MRNLPASPLSIEDIRQALQNPLPGKAGQAKMAPEMADGQPDRWQIEGSCQEAAVLLLFYPHITSAGSELHLVLTRRTEYPGAHSGQISLPGGRQEDGETLQATALRETCEEVGVSPEEVQVIGKLSGLYTPPSNFCIQPFIAFSPARPEFELEAKEVAELIETPLSLLLAPETRRQEIWNFPNYGTRRVPFYDIFGHKVWGATAMILSEFLTLLDT